MINLSSYANVHDNQENLIQRGQTVDKTITYFPIIAITSVL